METSSRMVTRDKQEVMKGTLVKVATGYTLSVLVVKVIISAFSGSLSVVSETVDVVMDLLLLALVRYATKKSNEPADSSHTYGHGKYETVFSILQTIIMIGIYVLLIENSIRALASDVAPAIAFTSSVILVFTILGSANMAIGILFLYKTRKLHAESIKMQGLNYLFDGTRSFIIVLAMFIYGMGFPKADPAFALVISGFVIFFSIVASRDAFANILERNPLSDEEMFKIYNNTSMVDEVIAIRDVRAKRMGDVIFLSFIVEMDGSITLQQAHEKIQEIRHRIQELLDYRKMDIMIHAHSVDG